MTTQKLIPFHEFTDTGAGNYYENFVASRVKWFPTHAEDLHHAATGMIGEAVELLWAGSRNNMLEELGDFEFYLTHGFLAVEQADQEYPLGTATLDPSCLTEGFHFLIKHSANLLDLTKKAWVYKKDLSLLPLTKALFDVEATFVWLLDYLEIDRLELRYSNYCKLMKRYPEGYTDAAAQARADKAGENDNG